MLKNSFVLIVFLFGIGKLNAQYLGFDDFVKLLDLAEERVEAEKFLKINGFAPYNFEYLTDYDEYEEGDTTHYLIDYYKKLLNDEYYVRVIGNTDDDLYTVMEFSSNEDRSFYFVDILSQAGIKPVDEWDNGDGDEGFKFETKKYMMTLAKSPDDDDAMRYRFSISKY